MMSEIVCAQTKEQLEQVGRVFREYEEFLGVDLCFQHFDAELDTLPGRYAPPRGALLLVMAGDEAAGCVALRDLGDGICEMKRLFVRPRFRGSGLGRRLAEAIIDEARRIGYRLMRLDTLAKLKEAMQLYESLGFRQIPPYYDNPLPDVVYWELDLGRRLEG